MAVVILVVGAAVAALVTLVPPRPLFNRPSASSCINNLRQLDGALQQWALENKLTNGAPATCTDLLPYLKGQVLPVCPNGGAYSITQVGQSPRCSAGHTL